MMKSKSLKAKVDGKQWKYGSIPSRNYENELVTLKLILGIWILRKELQEVERNS